MQKEITFDRFIRWTGTCLLIVAVLALIKYLSGVLLPFFIAWFFAYLLYPLVKFVQYRLHIKVRALAIIITMLIVGAAIGGLLWLVIPPLFDQADKLVSVINRRVNGSGGNNLIEMLRHWVENNRSSIENFFKSRDFAETLKSGMPKIFSIVGQTASVIISVIASCITLLYTFFILYDYEYLTKNWIRIFPVKHRPFWHGVMGDVERELNHYIRGQGTVSLCMGLMFCVAFTIIDLPLGIGLGILIGVLNLVPYLHTFALIPAAFLALLKSADTGQNFLVVFGMVIAVFIIVQIISDMVVTPKVMGKAMGLNPAILLLSLSVWGALLGFIGLIIALPLTTLIMAYWQRYVTKESAELPESGDANVKK